MGQNKIVAKKTILSAKQSSFKLVCAHKRLGVHLKKPMQAKKCLRAQGWSTGIKLKPGTVANFIENTLTIQV